MSELIRHSVGKKIQIETHLNAQWWTRCDVNQMENVILPGDYVAKGLDFP
jgi:hypothetical protein